MLLLPSPMGSQLLSKEPWLFLEREVENKKHQRSHKPCGQCPEDGKPLPPIFQGKEGAFDFRSHSLTHTHPQ